MDEVVLTVDDREYKLRDLAFYLAYEEMIINGQAKVYSLDNTKKYWNIHTNGSFLRVAGRDTAMEQAIHDAIFYQMAEDEGVELTEDEWTYMENQEMDFWSDLEDEGREGLGITEEELKEVFRQMALAQKEQQALADEEGVDYREYNSKGTRYEALLEQHTYQYNKKLWKRLNFGNITVNRQ
jgi:hypothetical protein